jgi:hypothetical protein
VDLRIVVAERVGEKMMFCHFLLGMIGYKKLEFYGEKDLGVKFCI